MVGKPERPRPAIRWPRPVAPAVYAEAREAWLDRLFATGQVRAAYQMGGVGAPGLSDLDLLVVCRDPIEGDLNAAADIAALGEEARYVFMHSQFLMNEEVFRRQRALFFGSDLRHVRGERFAVEEPAPEVADVLRLAFHVEMMAQRLAGCERVRAGHEVPAVRPLLAALHSIRFNVEAAARWCDVSAVAGYGAAVGALRGAWFTLDREEAYDRLMEMVGRASVTLGELLGRLRPAVAALCPGLAPDTAGTVSALEIHEVQRYGPFAPEVRFRRNPLGRALPASLRGRRAVRPHLAPGTEVRLPGEHFAFAALQAQALRDLDAGALARRVRGTLTGRPAPVLSEAMEERAAALVALRSFAARNRLRRLSYLVSACWHRPYPWQFRVKARLLQATRMF